MRGRYRIVGAAAGRPAKKVNGFALAATSGIPSTLGASAQPACIGGMKRNAYHAADGRRIRISMHSRKGTNYRREGVR